MIHITNKETRALDVCYKKGVSGARIVLLPGLNDVDEAQWKQALAMKWTAKLFGRKAIEGPKELDGVKLFGTDGAAKAVKKPAAKAAKKPETESFD